MPSCRSTGVKMLRTKVWRFEFDLPSSRSNRMSALAGKSSHKWEAYRRRRFGRFSRRERRSYLDSYVRRCTNSTSVYQLPVLASILIWFGSVLVNLLCGTLRYKVIDEAGFLDGPFPGPVIILIGTTAFSRCRRYFAGIIRSGRVCSF